MMESQNLQTPAPTPTPGQSPNKNNLPIILSAIGAVVVILAIIIGIVVFASMNKKDDTKDSSKNTNSSKTEGAKKSDDVRGANAVTAKTMGDLGTVCKNGSIKNAAAFAKPYKIAAFHNNSPRGSWSATTLSSNNDTFVQYDNLTEVNTIACLDRDDSTAVKSMTCELKSGGETVTIDYYAVQYKVTLYEAQTGKKIKELAAVSGPATSCPLIASFNKADPKLYGSADKTELEASLTAFAQ